MNSTHGNSKKDSAEYWMVVSDLGIIHVDKNNDWWLSGGSNVWVALYKTREKAMAFRRRVLKESRSKNKNFFYSFKWLRTLRAKVITNDRKSKTWWSRWAKIRKGR